MIQLLLEKLEMANLAKQEFIALEVSGKNYMSWTLDAELHLGAMGLEDTIKMRNTMSSQDRAKALIFSPPPPPRITEK